MAWLTLCREAREGTGPPLPLAGVPDTVRVMRDGKERTYLLVEESDDGSLLLHPLAPETAANHPDVGMVATAPAPPAAEAEAVLDVRDLAVSYGTRKAVDGVSFQIRRAEIFGLLGPNGAGKTSTLSAIEGLIRPKAGTMILDGIDIRERPAEVKARIGVQLQATSFQPQLTITQILRLYAGLYGVRLTDAEIAQRLTEIGL